MLVLKKYSAKCSGYECSSFPKTLPHSFCACVRNTPKIVKVVIGKMKLVSFSLFLYASPPPPPLDPRCPLDNHKHVAINIYNICKGHFGSRGGGHLKIK